MATNAVFFWDQHSEELNVGTTSQERVHHDTILIPTRIHHDIGPDISLGRYGYPDENKPINIRNFKYFHFVFFFFIVDVDVDVVDFDADANDSSSCFCIIVLYWFQERITCLSARNIIVQSESNTRSILRPIQYLDNFNLEDGV